MSGAGPLVILTCPPVNPEQDYEPFMLSLWNGLKDHPGIPKGGTHRRQCASCQITVAVSDQGLTVPADILCVVCALMVTAVTAAEVTVMSLSCDCPKCQQLTGTLTDPPGSLCRCRNCRAQQN